jgi:hypothetical protein
MCESTSAFNDIESVSASPKVKLPEIVALPVTVISPVNKESPETDKALPEELWSICKTVVPVATPLVFARRTR